MDPHDVLNLPREGFSRDQLKFNYKALARQLHPDKCRLSSEAATQLFQVLTEAYRKLSEELDRKHVDRTFMELRDGARRANPDAPSSSSSRANDEPTSKRFNIEKFNRVFSENRLEDPIFDTGYGKWMEETDPEVANKTGGKNLIRYEEPQPMVFTNKNTVPYTELGITNIDVHRNRSSFDQVFRLPPGAHHDEIGDRGRDPRGRGARQERAEVDRRSEEASSQHRVHHERRGREARGAESSRTRRN